MRLLLSAVSSAFMVVSSWSVAAAADCDFNKRVGSCKAQIEIRSSSGSKGSYSAEIIVRSSAPTCSKVDYYLDNTPQRAILKGGNAEPESVFGTRPISRKNFKVEKCAAFEDRQNAAQGGDQKGREGLKSFTGTWQGKVGWMMVSAPMTLNLRVNGNSVTGNSSSPNGQSYEIQNGRVSGNTVSYTYQQPSGDGEASVRITMKSANSISYSASASGITMSGTLQRQ
ncbi:hypothetical protein [Mesorhizobium sp. DCY119]|uniref:hypothetical protein n=1 Tax=Mesorhizobium sp. DCY119 TaxID=2108445 RepID=UPI0010588AAA|nr:hypothetical protein [Mesorhizobium sp. DCY119]